MWIALVIAILCIVMMFLLVLALYKTNMFQQEKDELNANIVEKAREIRDLKDIRKALNHDNTLLLEVNEKQRKILTEVANISTTYLVEHEKEAIGKIKELTRDYSSNVSSK